jgi:YD repeat-containing protein
MTNRMMKILLLLTFVLMTGAASAQQRTIYDTSGKVVGRSATYTSGTVTNYDARGRVVCRESTSGNTTTVYVIADATSADSRRAVSRNH